MNTSALDNRENDEIIKEIQKKAASYTPEWKFDDQNPDIGTALALVYAEQFSNTLKRFNRIALKNEIAFFNSLNASLLPAAPAHGFVQFSLVNGEWGGVEVAMQTIVSAEDETRDNGIIEYETVDDIYVTPARIKMIYQTADSCDYISRNLRVEDETITDIPLFSFQAENLQEHVCYFSHDTVLKIEHNAVIGLRFFEQDKKGLDEELLQALNCETTATFEYYTADGFIPFAGHLVRDGCFICVKGENQPPFEQTEISGMESYWIRCSVHKINAVKKLGIGKLLFETSGTGIEPETVYGNGVECNLNEYFPFGETIGLYNEVYFGSQEVFGKRGAHIELSFGVDFVKVPLTVSQDMIEWEWVMKRSDFKPNLEYDITIESVIWEYYNGNGWARLFPDQANSQIFSTQGGTMGQYKTLSFTAPADISPILINARDTYYIRARIMKVNNMYKTMGNYIIPVLGNTVLSYRYSGQNSVPSAIITKNNLEERVYKAADLSKGEKLYPFYQTGYENPALYLGFETPPVGAPVKYLMTIRDNIDRSDSLLVWEYYSGNRWSEMNLVDETENFSRTGIITIAGTNDFAAKKLFGQELYWIRIRDVNGYYGKRAKGVSRPILSGLYENTTKIINVDRRETEYFTMMVYQENMRFTLLYQNIYDIRVLVNEKESLSERQLAVLIKQDQVILVKDSSGLVTQAWVRWNGVEDFIESDSQDRHFTYSPTEGYVLFGNGKRGMIPPPSREPNIQVRYRTGGGVHTNVGKGRVNKLNRAIGFINEVRNPEALAGGCDAETLADSLARNAAVLKTQKKAVTARDFEELARMASRDIRLVQCFSCYDDQGESCSGAVTLVVLQKNFREGHAQFNRVKNEIFQYLKDRIYGNMVANKKFFIIEPKFVEIRIRAEAVVRDFNMIFKVKKELLSRLEEFLNPTEEGQDWKIGSLPNNMQIQNAISNVQGLSYIKKVFISTYTNENGVWKEVDTIPNRIYVFPISGEHDVVITVE